LKHDHPPLEALIKAVREEAERAEFPIDVPVYERWGRDPREPILCAGLLEAPLCVVGRDLGKDEVRAGEPQIGQAGRLVRRGIVAAWGEAPAPSAASDGLEQALGLALLTNMVPYKPPGNKAYPEAVRSRFRPFLESLLVEYWQGNQLITLGSDAFAWFSRYIVAESGQLGTSTADRFQQSYRCRIASMASGGHVDKEVTVYPLPHPSPLNRRWYSLFPSMLAGRLAEIRPAD
jgi:uracil-DNA glycosylase